MTTLKLEHPAVAALRGCLQWAEHCAEYTQPPLKASAAKSARLATEALAASAAYDEAVGECVAALRAYEADRDNMEDRAPLEPDCIECNQGTGPHKRTCAHHLARTALAKIARLGCGQ